MFIRLGFWCFGAYTNRIEISGDALRRSIYNDTPLSRGDALIAKRIYDELVAIGIIFA